MPNWTDENGVSHFNHYKTKPPQCEGYCWHKEVPKLSSTGRPLARCASIYFIKVARSGLAIEVRPEDEERAVWIPISQIDEDSDLSEHSEEGEVGDLIIPQWLAQEKELIWSAYED